MINTLLKEQAYAIDELFDMSQARADRYEAALERLRDCDWVITLPDPMDAVRSIACNALEGE